MHGVLVPGGFGRRGVEGKIRGIHCARTQGIPFLGICLGLQLATIEFARNVCGMEGANSTEFDPDTPHPVVDFLPGQRDQDRKGATMRLGSYECEIEDGSLARRIYGSPVIHERHRHRYEVMNPRIGPLLERGFRVSGIHRGPLSEGTDPLPDGRRGLVEFVEIPDHPFFAACQFHPEYKSRPLSPHPLFAAFVRAAMQRAQGTGLPTPAMEET
jgi:CTP synthase